MTPSDHAFGGKWTTEKLELVRKYLAAYATIMAKQHFRFAYIDAFAGTGYRSLKQDDVDQLMFPELAADDAFGVQVGSARMALDVEPRFDKYILIERHGARVDELRTLAGAFPELADRIQVVEADANSYLRDRCLNYNWSSHRAAMFLDPYGMQVDWETVEAIAATEAMDLWYLFPLGIAVNRLLKRDGNVNEVMSQRLDALFGTHDWHDAFYRVSREASLLGDQLCLNKATFDEIGSFFNDRLRTVFAGVAKKPRALCNSKNNPLYLLCFAAGNQTGAKTAVKIADDIMGKV